MESINECFLLEKELRGVVQKGMRGNVGAVEYLEEVRVYDAEVLFWTLVAHVFEHCRLPMQARFVRDRR